MRVSPSRSAFLRAPGEILADERRCGFAFFFVMALKGLSYWIVFKWLHPDAALDDLLFFRRNDIEYFQLIAPLARLDFSSFSAFEHHGTGMLAMPLLQAAPYALGYAVFGTAGIAAADIAISLATFVLFAWLLLETGYTVRLAKILALGFLVVEVTLTRFLEWHVGFGQELTQLWDLRFPKPFVSFPLVLWVLLWTAYLCRRRNTLTPELGIVTALGYAALIQTDVYRGFPLHLLLPALLVAAAVLAQRSGNLRAFLRATVAFAATYVLAMLPFLLQRVYETADIADRMGFYPVDRLAPPFPRLQDLNLALLPLAGYLLLAGVLAARGRASKIGPLAQLLAGASFCALLSMPAMGFVYGGFAEAFHFAQAWNMYASLLFLALPPMAYAGLGRPPLPATIRSVVGALTFAAVPVMALYALYVPYFDAGRRQVQIQIYEPLDALGNYRHDSIALRRELRAGALSGARVIGTFDPHVAFYSVYLGRDLYLPDGGLDVVPEREQLSRLAAFCALLRLPEAEAERLLERDYVHLYWGTVQKYSVERFRFKPEAAEYGDLQQEAIGSVAAGFIVRVPRLVVQRLMADYRRFVRDPAATGQYRLDAIVLARTEDTRNAHPDPQIWESGFENGSFRTWVRRANARPL